MSEKTILILGGGFGGVMSALKLAKRKLPNTRIVLVSDRPHFEYHGTLYRVLTGHSPLEVCVPLNEIFEGKNVEVLVDKITEVRLNEKKVLSASKFVYKYGTLVLAMGSEVAYYDTVGLKELSYAFDSINSVLKLKRHLHSIFDEYDKSLPEEKVQKAHVVVVGGGVTGCEVAGELATYMKKLAKQHNVDPSFITIDLIHAGNRLVPMLPIDVSEKIEKRLHNLGVNIFLNRQVLKEDLEQVYLKDMEMKTKTLIWTAGVKTNSIYETIEGLEFDQKKKVIVDEFMQPKGFEDVFVIGDAAATKFTGMAKTAMHDGAYIAEIVGDKILGHPIPKYEPKKVNFSIPVGEKWAATLLGNLRFYGYLGWIGRKFNDLKVFLSILPLSKAFAAFRSDKILCETCPVCCELQNEMAVSHS